jgi:hypothetical protein
MPSYDPILLTAWRSGRLKTEHSGHFRTGCHKIKRTPQNRMPQNKTHPSGRNLLQVSCRASKLSRPLTPVFAARRKSSQSCSTSSSGSSCCRGANIGRSRSSKRALRLRQWLSRGLDAWLRGNLTAAVHLVGFCLCSLSEERCEAQQSESSSSLQRERASKRHPPQHTFSASPLGPFARFAALRSFSEFAAPAASTAAASAPAGAAAGCGYG